MIDGKPTSDLQSSLADLSRSLDSHAHDEVIFGILCDLYFESLSNSPAISSAPSITAERLFAQYPALAHTPSLRGLTLWAELSSRVSFALTDPLFNNLDDAEHASTEQKLQTQELRRLTERFPDDAAQLQEQLSVYCVVRDHGCRSDTALQNIDPRYTPLALLGSGWFGSVYLAWDEALDRDVAIKIPYPSTLDTDSSIFLNEARNAAQLQHENIARVIDFAQNESSCYIIYEYVRNAQDLDDYCQSHRLTLSARLELLAQICNGLAHAHRYQIVHRDLKPANILVSEGQIRLADFGLSTNQNKLYREFNARAGTLEYMSPEQKAGEPATDKSDVYSLGIIAEHLFADCAKPRRLKQLIRRCTSITPSDRPSAERCLGTIQLLKRLHTRRKSIALLATVLAVTVFGLVVASWRNRWVNEQSYLDGLLVRLVQYKDAWQNSHDNPRNLGLQTHEKALKQELLESVKHLEKRSKPIHLWLDSIGGIDPSNGCLTVVHAALQNAEGQPQAALNSLNGARPFSNPQWQYQFEYTQGQALQALRRCREAIRSYKRAAAIYRAPEAILSAAECAVQDDDIETAISLIVSALDDVPKNDPTPQIVSTRARYLSQLAEAYRKDGQAKLAIETIRESIALFEALSRRHDDYKPNWGTALLQLATLQSQSAELEDSLTTFLQSETVFRELVDHDDRFVFIPKLAHTLTKHSTALQKLNQFEKALSLSTEAESLYAQCIAAKLAFDIDRAESLLEMASCHLQLQHTSEALELMKRAESIYRESRIDPDLSTINLAITLGNHAYWLTATTPNARNEEAIAAASEAIDLFKKIQADGKLTVSYQQAFARVYQVRSVARDVLRASEVERRQAQDDALRAKELLGTTFHDMNLYGLTMHQLAITQRVIDPALAIPTYDEAIEKLRFESTIPAKEALAILFNERSICRFLLHDADFKLVHQDALQAQHIAGELSDTGSPHAREELEKAEKIIKAVTPYLGQRTSP